MYSYEDLKKAPVGTKMTFKNGFVFIKNCDIENFEDLSLFNKAIKIEEPVYTTVYEVKEILDEEEKKYLSEVIKPSRIRKNVKYIVKHEDCWDGETTLEYLVIANKEYYGNNITSFAFNKGTMYKNMELDRKYTLEELDL